MKWELQPGVLRIALVFTALGFQEMRDEVQDQPRTGNHAHLDLRLWACAAHTHRTYLLLSPIPQGGSWEQFLNLTLTLDGEVKYECMHTLIFIFRPQKCFTLGFQPKFFLIYILLKTKQKKTAWWYIPTTPAFRDAEAGVQQVWVQSWHLVT